MPTVGRTLVTERIRQGLELEDIARVTKLSPRALQAIEADDFEQLPGTVFARKFVEQYAAALHLDPAALVHQFDREQSVELPAFTLAQARPAPRATRLPESRLSGVYGSNLLSAFTTFVVTLTVCAALYYGYQYLQSRSVVSQARANTPAPVSVPVKSAPAVPIAKAPDAPVPTPVAPATTNVRVDVVAVDPCWVRIISDGKSIFVGVLAAGESRSIDADSAVSIRAGNAAALAIKLNGNDVPPIGPKGQIRVVTLTAAGAQVRAPTSEAVAADF